MAFVYMYGGLLHRGKFVLGVGLVYTCIHVSAYVHVWASNRIVIFRVMSPFVINYVPTRDLLVPCTKRSFQIVAGTLALQWQCL